MTYEYIPKGVCPSKILFELQGDVVCDVRFIGGCDGNLKALCRVIRGMTVQQVEENFRGIACGSNVTSCTDQLAIAVKQAYEESKSGVPLPEKSFY